MPAFSGSGVRGRGDAVGEGESDRDRGASLQLALHPELPAMEVGDAAGDGEAEAGALLLLLLAIELGVGPDAGHLLRAHAVAGVDDLQDGLAVGVLQRHLDLGSGEGELEGVVDEFVRELGEEVLTQCKREVPGGEAEL